MPNEITSGDTIRALFVSAFPQQLNMKMLESPNVAVYIKDDARKMYYELGDVRNKFKTYVSNTRARKMLVGKFSSSKEFSKIHREIVYTTREGQHTMRQPMGPPPPHVIPSSLPPPAVHSMPPSPSRIPFGGPRTMVLPGSATIPRDRLSSVPPSRSISPSPSAILERRDVKPDEDMSNKNVSLMRNEGLYADPYMHHEGRLSIASSHSGHPGDMQDHSVGYHRGSIRERMKAMEKQIASLTGLVQSALLKGPNTSSAKEASSENTMKTASLVNSTSSGAAVCSIPAVKSSAGTVESTSMITLPPAGGCAPAQGSLLHFRKNVSDLRLQLQHMRQLQDYCNLERYVDELHRDSTSATVHRAVTLKDVEDGAVSLRKVGESLAGLKGEFPTLQNKMRAVLRVEVEAVRFLKEEPHKLDSLLKRVKTLTESLTGLRRCATETTQVTKTTITEYVVGLAESEAPITVNMQPQEQGVRLQTLSQPNSPSALPEPQSSSIKSEVMPASPMVIHHVQSAPVVIQQSQHSATLLHHSQSPPATPPLRLHSSPMAVQSLQSTPVTVQQSQESSTAILQQNHTTPNPEQAAQAMNTGNESTTQSLLVEEIQTSRTRNRNRVVSIEAAEKEWEEKRLNVGHYDGKQFEKLLQEAQANMMKGIPSLEVMQEAAPPPLPPPPNPDEVDTPHILEPQAEEAPHTEPGIEKAVKSPPPPPPPRRTYPPGSGLTTGRSGEVIFMTRQEAVSAQEAEEAAAQVQQTKLPRSPSESKPPPQTPPPIAASSSREEEDEGVKIMAELQVFQKCTFMDVGTKSIVEHPRVETQVREIRPGALISPKEKKVIYYLTGQISNELPSLQMEELKEPNTDGTAESNHQFVDNEPFIFQECSYVESQGNFPDRQHQFKMSYTETQQEVSDVEQKQEMQTIHYHQKEEPTKTIPQNGSIEDAMIKMSTEKFEANNASPLPTEMSVSHLNSLIKNQEAPVILESPQEWTEDDGHSEQVVLRSKSSKSMEIPGEEKQTDTDENGNETSLDSRGVIYYVTGQISNELPSVQMEELKEPNTDGTAESNHQFVDNEPFIFQECSYVESQGNFPDRQHQFQMSYTETQQEVPDVEQKQEMQTIHYHQKEEPTKTIPQNGSIEDAMIKMSTEKFEANNASPLPTEMSVSHLNSLIKNQEAPVILESPQEWTEDDGHSEQVVLRSKSSKVKIKYFEDADPNPSSPSEESPTPIDNIAFMITDTEVQALSCGECQEIVKNKGENVQTVNVDGNREMTTQDYSHRLLDTEDPSAGLDRKPVIIIFDEPMDIRSAYKRLSTIFESEEELERMLAEERIDEENEEAEETDSDRKEASLESRADRVERADQVSSVDSYNCLQRDHACLLEPPGGSTAEAKPDVLDGSKQDAKKKFKFKFPKKQLAALTQAIRTGTKTGKKTLQVVVYEEEEEPDGTVKQQKEAKRFEIRSKPTDDETTTTTKTITTVQQASSNSQYRTDEIRKNTYKTLDSLEQTIKQLETTISEMGPKSPEETVLQESRTFSFQKAESTEQAEPQVELGSVQESATPVYYTQKGLQWKKSKPQLLPRPAATTTVTCEQSSSTISSTSRMPVPMASKSRQQPGSPDKAGTQQKLQDPQRQFRQANGSAKKAGGDYKATSPTLPASKIPAFSPSSGKGSSASAPSSDSTNPILSSSSKSSIPSTLLNPHASRSAPHHPSSSSHIPSGSNGSLRLQSPTHTGKGQSLSISPQTQNGRPPPPSSSSPSPVSSTSLSQGVKSIRTIHTPSFISYKGQNGKPTPSSSSAKESAQNHT
ncbi:UNVERIFIED_CONTAM: hypothetical protein FKN15_075641 [Acipenser sinensis]